MFTVRLFFFGNCRKNKRDKSVFLAAPYFIHVNLTIWIENFWNEPWLNDRYKYRTDSETVRWALWNCCWIVNSILCKLCVCFVPGLCRSLSVWVECGTTIFTNVLHERASSERQHGHFLVDPHGPCQMLCNLCSIDVHIIMIYKNYEHYWTYFALRNIHTWYFIIRINEVSTHPQYIVL